MKLNPKLKSVLIFCIKLVVTLVPAYFVYQNIVSDPEWDVGDLSRLFKNNSALPLVFALLCLAVSNFTACYQWKTPRTIGIFSHLCFSPTVRLGLVI